MRSRIVCSGEPQAENGEFALMTWSPRTLLILLVTAGIWGCAAMVPERRIPVEKPGIQEEDVTEGQSGKFGGTEEPAQVPSEVSPGAPAETPYQPLEPGSRPPRRIPFRDRRSDRAELSVGKAGTIVLVDCHSVLLSGSIADGARNAMGTGIVQSPLGRQWTCDIG